MAYFIGIDTSTTATRALLIKSAGLTSTSQVRVTGGGARSPLWRQILADVLQAEIVTVNTTEGAAFGAALLAAAGTGGFRSVEAACDATIRITGSTAPGDGQELYDRLYPLYPALTPTFHAVGS